MSTTDDVPFDAVLPADQLVEAFVAGLVTAGRRNLEPRSDSARRGFQAIVRLLDQQIEDFRREGKPLSELWPWIETANQLRPSTLGGVENWEHQLRAAQRVFTRVHNPSYERVELAIDPATAQGELRKLNNSQLRLVRKVVKTFQDEYTRAA